MDKTQQKTKYFKEYYKKNKSKFYERNHNRASNRKYFYAITVGGKKYCFQKKKDIIVEKICLHEMIKNDIIMMNSD